MVLLKASVRHSVTWLAIAGTFRILHLHIILQAILAATLRLVFD
jgi:hypothetical protein